MGIVYLYESYTGSPLYKGVEHDIGESAKQTIVATRMTSYRLYIVPAEEIALKECRGCAPCPKGCCQTDVRTALILTRGFNLAAGRGSSERTRASAFHQLDLVASVSCRSAEG